MIDSTTQFLDDNVVLLCPTFSYWRGQYQLSLDGIKTTVGEIEVDFAQVTAPRAKLLTDAYPLDKEGTPWKKRFNQIESALTKLKQRYSVPFPINGVRIIPKAKVTSFLDAIYGNTVASLKYRFENTPDSDPFYVSTKDAYERVKHLPDMTPLPDNSKEEQSLAYQLWTTAQDFVANLDDVWDQLSKKSVVWESVKSRVPRSGADMLSRFRIDVVPIELATRTITAGSTADLLKHKDVVQETCRRRVADAIEAMVSEPRQQLGEALANLSDLIARDGKLTSRSFQPVREAIAKIRLFDCVADEDLMLQIDAMEKRLNVTTPKLLNTANAASSGFSAAINSLYTEIDSADAKANALNKAMGRVRAIKLD